MRAKRTLLGICALLLLTSPILAQQEDERKVSVDIEVEENGETRTVKKDFILREGQSLEEALKELGIMDELGEIESDERLEIDIRRFLDDSDIGNMQIRFFNDDGNGMVFGDCGPKPFLGVYMGNSEEEGAAITKVVEGSAAESAGLKAGDRIIRIDDDKISDQNDLVDAIDDRDIDQAISITYVRDGKERITNATLKEKENTHAFMWKSDEDASGNFFQWDSDEDVVFHNEPRAFLGVRGDNVEKGLQITEVIEGTAAEKAGLQKGDIIQEVNGEEVNSIGGLADQLNGMAPGDEVEIRVIRDGKKQRVNAELGEQKSHRKVRTMHIDSDNDFDFDYDFDFDMDGMSEEDKRELKVAMKELKETLKNEFKELREEFGELNEMRRETRVIIVASELSKEEKQMLERSGVDNLNRELDVDLELFPNPSDGLFQLNFDTSDRGDLSVEVYDSSGNQVYMERLIDVEGPYNGRIDLTNRANGNYFLIVSQDGRTISRKLTKQ